MTAQVAADLRAARAQAQLDLLYDLGNWCNEFVREAKQSGDPGRALTSYGVWSVVEELGRRHRKANAELRAAADAAERQAAYDEGRWCGECVYGVVMDPPCCTQGPVQQ